MTIFRELGWIGLGCAGRAYDDDVVVEAYFLYKMSALANIVQKYNRTICTISSFFSFLWIVKGKPL